MLTCTLCVVSKNEGSLCATSGFICVVLCKKCESQVWDFLHTQCYSFHLPPLWPLPHWTFTRLATPNPRPPPPTHPLASQLSLLHLFPAVSLPLIYLKSSLNPLFDVAFSFAGGRQRRSRGGGSRGGEVTEVEVLRRVTWGWERERGIVGLVCVCVVGGRKNELGSLNKYVVCYICMLFRRQCC